MPALLCLFVLESGSPYTSQASLKLTDVAQTDLVLADLVLVLSLKC